MAKAVTPSTPEFRAEAKFQRGSPQKAKLVLDLIKGKRIEAAINIVSFTNKRWSPVVEKVLRSAVQKRGLRFRRKGSRHRCRQPLRQDRHCERRPAHEAHPPCSNGSRIPLPRAASRTSSSRSQRRSLQLLPLKLRQPRQRRPPASQQQRKLQPRRQQPRRLLPRRPPLRMLIVVSS